MITFFILTFILSFSGLVITLKTLIGYNPEFSTKRKLCISFFVVFSWYCPLLIRIIRKFNLLSEPESIYVKQVLYVFFISAIFLLAVLLVRDFLWGIGYIIVQKSGRDFTAYDPMKPDMIKKANVIAFVMTVFLAGFSIYEGVKFPSIKETEIITSKLNTPFKIAVLSDTHITSATSLEFIEKLVQTVNGLKPDITVLVGDIVDGKPEALNQQMQILSKLEAKHGVFVTLGNHEFYHGSLAWERKYKDMGLFYLANNGLFFNNANVFISGLPDPQMLKITQPALEVIKDMLNSAPEKAYRVFLSHSPRFIKKLSKDLIDLQISGHTHGGQIFPFHFFVKRFNDFVAGLYDVDGMKLYVSRGTGGWGPPMRLFAPSEISLIKLVPEKINATD